MCSSDLGTAAEPANSGAYYAENSEGAVDADADKDKETGAASGTEKTSETEETGEMNEAEDLKETEREDMQDARKDGIAEAIEQETAAVELETDDSQDTEETAGEPTAEISELIPTKYSSRRYKQCGTIEHITYPSYDYFGDGSALEKPANVYLPYGYDETKQYNVLYLMHGIGGDENEWGMVGNTSQIKMIMDNLIFIGKISP